MVLVIDLSRNMARTHDYYQRNQFVERGSYNWLEFDNDPGKYWRNVDDCRLFDLAIPQSKDWDESKDRLLIVLQYVDTEDLKQRKLCSTQSGVVLTNLLRYAKERYKQITGKNKNFAVTVINYNYFKTYHLPRETQEQAHTTCVNRINAAVEEFEPTHLLVVGDDAAGRILDLKNSAGYYRGWYHKLEINGVKVRATHTIDYSGCYIAEDRGDNLDDDEDADEGGGYEAGEDEAVDKTNLLGFVGRCMLTLFHNGMLWSIADVRPNYRMVDTIERFDKFMDLLEQQMAVATDTETRNLTVTDNSLLISQWAWSRDLAYIIPVEHKDSPFSTKEIAYIKQRLRDYVGRKIKYKRTEQRYLVMHNASFDLRVYRQELEIPVIHWPVFDTMAGAWCLDENLKAMRSFAKKEDQSYGKLLMQCCHYGNDFYVVKEGFAKEDRANMEASDLNDTTFRDYLAFDVQGLWALHEEQLAEAASQRMWDAGDSYGEHYKHFVLTQMSNNIHMFSQMEQRGSYVDTKHLLKLMRDDSPIKVELEKELKKFFGMPNVQKANALLAKEAKLPANGLFGKVSRWMFDLGKPAHKMALFFKVMDLEPVGKGKPTKDWPQGQPSLGKAFQETYKKDFPEVKALERISKLKKLISSYIQSFYRKISESVDGRSDSRLRPGFGFFDVVTGRSNSYNPSLQQIPQRSAEAKYIKRMFSAMAGQLLLKLDFSAHEVRGWSFSSGDKKLGKLFKVGRELRKIFAETFDPRLPYRIKIEGDLHRLNVARFYGIDLATVASDILEGFRDLVKAIVFGAIYGRSVKSIANAIKKEKKETQIVYDKFFAEYPVAKKWLDWAIDIAVQYLHVPSMIGRKRNLFGYMSGSSFLMSAMDRRAQNSPIQGLGADIAHSAARLFTLRLEKVSLDLGFRKPGYKKAITGVETMVHDSTRMSVFYRHFMVTMQLANWCYTTGAELYYRKEFGIKLTCPLEIEFEIGFDESSMKKYNWAIIDPSKLPKIEADVITWLKEDSQGYERLEAEVINGLKKQFDAEQEAAKKKAATDDKPAKFTPPTGKDLRKLIVKAGVDSVYKNSLCAILKSALETQKKEQDPELDVDAAFDEIYTDWVDSDERKYMDKHYPWWDDADAYED